MDKKKFFPKVKLPIHTPVRAHPVITIGKYSCPACHKEGRLQRAITEEEGQMGLIHKPMTFEFDCEKCNKHLIHLKGTIGLLQTK